MADPSDGQKYLSPDYDPNDMFKYRNKYMVIKNLKERNRNRQKRSSLEIRMLWPFTLACSKCNHVMFVGTKYNARVFKIREENYLGLPIHAIDGKCSGCQNHIRLVTDPKNLDYVIRCGAKRLFDRNVAQKKLEDDLATILEQEKLDPEFQITRSSARDRDAVTKLFSLLRLRKALAKSEPGGLSKRRGPTADALLVAQRLEQFDAAPAQRADVPLGAPTREEAAALRADVVLADYSSSSDSENGSESAA